MIKYSIHLTGHLNNSTQIHFQTNKYTRLLSHQAQNLWIRARNPFNSAKRTQSSGGHANDRTSITHLKSLDQ